MLQPIIKRSKRKTITIKINRCGELVVLAPFSTSDKTINDLILEKEKWIIKSINKVKSTNNQYQNKPTKDGDKIYILGKVYTLLIGEYKRAGIIENNFVLPVKYQNNPQNYIEKWYKDNAKVYLKQVLSSEAKRLNIEDFSFGITSSKTKWGSCNTSRKILLNYRLMLCPVGVIKYVALHELCHLEYMNHGKQYWEKVGYFCPNYKEYDKWLKDNQGILNVM